MCSREFSFAPRSADQAGLARSESVDGGYVESDGRVSGWFFTFFGHEVTSTTFKYKSTLVHRLLTKRKGAAKSNLARNVPTATKVLLLFHGIRNVSNCI